ncbi:MAG TPA: hypothetical protein VFL10_06455 [Ornithinibacter sp.]|nr:hypothetical protein [Ornithinibacter sp.]
MGAGRNRRRGTWAVALAVGVVLVGQPALADEGLATGGRSRFVLDPKATTVDATVTIDLRNTTPNRGGFFYYYDAFSVPVPAGAEKVRARSGGSSLSVSLKGTVDPSTRLARITFPNLLYGRTRTITLTYEVPGERPRSKDSTRVGPGYASFAVYGVGDSGRNLVEVVAPSSMTFDSTSDDFTSTEQGKLTTHSSDAVSPEGGSWAVVSLRDPARTDERVVDVAGVSLLLDGFQDDPKWSRFVAGQVTKGLPALEKLVGAKWPGGLERIREDASPSLRGYDGWFDPTDDEIVIGEQLDADLIFHELSHAWVSGERFDQRWLSEGLAQVLAERAVKATGGTPYVHPKVSRGSSDAVALNGWGGSAGSRSEAVDAYAYPASYAVTSSLVGRLDDAKLAAVLGAAIRGERAYDPPGTKDANGGRTDWMRWLDLLETRGGVPDGADVYRRWVLTGQQRAALAPRAKARAAYAAVDEADGAWLPPEGLRDAMTDWDFERADAVRAKVAGLGAAATAVQTAAQRAGIEVPDAVRAGYERAEQDEQYTALATTLPKAAVAVTAVGAAERAAGRDRDPVSALGATLLGVDDRAAEASALLDDGQYAAATTAADDATSRSDKALPVGLALPILLLLLVAGLVLWVRRAMTGHGRHGSEPEANPQANPGAKPGATPPALEEPVQHAAPVTEG